ncbi:CASP-like protein 2C1 [Curcuma longa]|uniref:CASP-like protein 2C1 n=1 Tax=Curcuma longa TaxID=136217 RepID=UPI003D9F3963
MELAGAECGMRALSLAFAATAALLVGLDRETETVIFIRRTATVKDLTALWVMTVTASVAAGYHLLQLCRCMASAAGLGRSSSLQSKLAAWLQFLLDQGAAYATFLTTMAGLQGGLVGVFGVRKLQWMKLCNIYGRLCKGMAGGVICALLATFAMAIVAAISAHRLFRLYSRVHRPGSFPSK